MEKYLNAIEAHNPDGLWTVSYTHLLSKFSEIPGLIRRGGRDQGHSAPGRLSFAREGKMKAQKSSLLVFVLSVAAMAPLSAAVEPVVGPTALRVDDLTTPLGIDDAAPHLSLIHI